MAFNSRSDFINAAASEKVVFAHVHANRRVINWSVHSGDIYKRTLSEFVNDVKLETVSLTRVTSLGAVVAGTFFYEISTKTVYIELLDSSNPVDSEMIIQYRLFYANKSFSSSWDLTDTGEHVHYEGRIRKSPAYDHQIGIEQNLSSIVGKGSLKLQNVDAELDEIFETLIFENQDVEIYNWNTQIPISESQIIYRGKVTNKFFDNDNVRFTVKDQLFDVLQNVPQQAFTDDDNVNDSVKGNIKRWVYGRVDGLKLQSVDQISDGYAITGTVSGTSDSLTLTGVGTTFLSELSPGDTLLIDTLELDIDDVISDTSLTLSDNPNYAFNGNVANVVPNIPTVTKNRVHFVAGHATAELTKTVVSVLQFNRVVLSDVIGLSPGDFIEFISTGERIEIKNTAPGNIIVLRQNMINIPTISSDVKRLPIQNLFVEGVEVLSNNFTINNSSSETTVTLDDDVEFNLARPRNINIDLTFTNGSRTISTIENVDLNATFTSRDWIRPANASFTTYYEILKVTNQSMTIRTVFVDATITDNGTLKHPEYVGDSTIVSCDVLGRTENNTPSGVWIETGAKLVQDVLNQVGITNIETSSFDDAAIDADHLVSMMIPSNPTSTLTKTKTVIDRINKSIFAALTLNNSLNLRYKVLLVESADDTTQLNDNDIKSFKIKATNGKTYRNSIVNYRHQDVIRQTLEPGLLTVSHESEFVRKYIGTNDTNDIDVYLYKTISAKIMSHRDIYYNQLSRATVTIVSDLRLENLIIGNVVVLNFDRLYKRHGDSSTRKKIAYIVGKKVDGEQITFILSDLSNTFNQSAIIAPNTTSDFSAATVDEKLKYGYITDANGIVDDNEDTANTNLIT
jgi:hypothetical protein